ncbi:MAG: hypothetical protein F6K08_20740, partial [Okeania sp. SIO1H6]|nr:hypothetical protein [Okeania sp. SIO1H6]
MKTSFQDSTTQTLTTPQDQNDRNKQLPVERPKKGKKWAIALVAAGLLALSTGIYLVRNQSQG